MPGAPRQKQETGRRGNKVRFHALKGMNRMLFISPQLGAPALASQAALRNQRPCDVEQAFQLAGEGDFPVARIRTKGLSSPSREVYTYFSVGLPPPII